jgi:hypothetical protein
MLNKHYGAAAALILAVAPMAVRAQTAAPHNYDFNKVADVFALNKMQACVASMVTATQNDVVIKQGNADGIKCQDQKNGMLVFETVTGTRETGKTTYVLALTPDHSVSYIHDFDMQGNESNVRHVYHLNADDQIGTLAILSDTREEGLVMAAGDFEPMRNLASNIREAAKNAR